jgi:hypothetical protein
MAEKLDIDPNGTMANALWANVDALQANGQQVAANTAAREITS